jgi:hypothetical protein
MLKLDVSAGFTGSVSGFVAGDSLDLGDVMYGSVSQLTYAANDAGTGGTLLVSDGTHAPRSRLWVSIRLRRAISRSRRHTPRL